MDKYGLPEDRFELDRLHYGTTAALTLRVIREKDSRIPEIKLRTSQIEFIWNANGGHLNGDNGLIIDEETRVILDLYDVYQMALFRADSVRSSFETKSQDDWNEIHAWERISGKIERELVKVGIEVF